MHRSIKLVDVHVRLGNVHALQGVNIEARPFDSQSKGFQSF